MAGRKGRSGGGNAKSVAQHKLDGTYEARRHKGKRRPAPTPGAPQPPGPLSAVGRREWNRMVMLLLGSELLTIVDGAMLFHYCELHAACEQIKRDLYTLARARKMSLIERLSLRAKLIGQARQHRQTIRMYLVEFGGSPAARNGLELSDAGASLGAGGDDMSEFDHPALTLVKT